MLSIEEIDKRLVELDQIINGSIVEKNQLIGYKSCLTEANNNDKVPGDAQADGDEVRSRADKVEEGSDT